MICTGLKEKEYIDAPKISRRIVSWQTRKSGLKPLFTNTGLQPEKKGIVQQYCRFMSQN